MPPMCNVRMVTGNSTQTTALLEQAKVYHFVGAKPWQRRDGRGMNQRWWTVADRMLDALLREGYDTSKLV